MGQVLFDTRIGDVSFPGLTPTSIDGMDIGRATPGSGVFTECQATNLDAPTLGAFTAPDATVSRIHVDTGTKTATATAGAATLAKMAGVITSEALTTIAGATYTLTLTNTDVAAADQVFASVQLGTATTGMPTVTTVTPAAGSVVIIVQNIHASAALNGAIKISFLVAKN